MDENKHKSLGWFIVLLEKWPANKDSHSGKYRLRKFFERYNFLKMASNIYATQIFEEKFEEWRSKIQYRLPKDGTANAIFVTCEQWENMKVYPALDKFKKKSQ